MDDERHSDSERRGKLAVVQGAEVGDRIILGRVHNETASPVRVFLEPWADEHLMLAGTTAEIIAARDGQVEITCLAQGDLELVVVDETGYIAFTVEAAEPRSMPREQS